MKTGGYINLKFVRNIKYISLLLLCFFHLNAYETSVSMSLGGGWKSNVDPAFSFRSASDIFSRSEPKSSGTMIFSAEGGIQSEKESGFVLDFLLSGLVSLQSVKNSTIYSGIDGGYLYSFNKNNMVAFLGGIHNLAYDYISMKSLFVDPGFSASYLYDSQSFHIIFLKAGFSYYISTNRIVEYLNGPSMFLEGGVRLNFNDNNGLDWFAGSSFTFFNDQQIKYNRYGDVYYGELEIEGKYFSLYSGLFYLFNVSLFSFPVSFKYIFSRSFYDDTHKIVYWRDVNIPSRIYEKVRIDNTIEFSAGVVFNINDNFSLKTDYFLHKNFSNVGRDFGDYADYSRLAHTFSVEIGYEY